MKSRILHSSKKVDNNLLASFMVLNYFLSSFLRIKSELRIGVELIQILAWNRIRIQASSRRRKPEPKLTAKKRIRISRIHKQLFTFIIKTLVNEYCKKGSIKRSFKTVCSSRFWIQHFFSIRIRTLY